MVVEVDGSLVRIRGNNYPGKYLKVWVHSENGEDVYSLSLIKDGIEHGGFPHITVSKSHVVVLNILEKGEQLLE